MGREVRAKTTTLRNVRLEKDEAVEASQTIDKNREGKALNDHLIQKKFTLWYARGGIFRVTSQRKALRKDKVFYLAMARKLKD